MCGNIGISDVVAERSVVIGEYVRDTMCTVRQAAVQFNVSKSTVHRDVTQILPLENYGLYEDVAIVLSLNKDDRARRGGQATKLKHAALKGVL